ncbi:hypothetical protein MMON_22460 [Mycolicibacterium monacense]|uniref:Uncharacterized protein n=1 Tax=Mycolicibacterium monacense TaxID=85693 RepID=A0AAD1IVT5_MYCMB|nr:hypothetical protein MMON_22460 [Mycolicibacterium monacense]
MPELPQFEIRFGGRQGLQRVGARHVEHRRTLRRQDRGLGERVRLRAAEEHQRRLPVLHPRVVRLHENRAALRLQVRRVGGSGSGIGEALRPHRTPADRGFDHDLTVRHDDAVTAAEVAGRHRRHPALRQLHEVSLVGVPGDDVRAVQQVAHLPRPHLELVETVDVVPRRP